MSPRRKTVETPNPKNCTQCGQPHGRCTAHNRAGKPCGRWPIDGGWVCGLHGGKAPQTQRKARKRVAEAEAVAAVAKFNLQRDIAPADALLEEVKRAAGMVDFYAAKILALDPDTNVDVLTWGLKESKSRVMPGVKATDPDIEVTEQKWTGAPITLVELWMRERKHLVEVASAAVRADAELHASQAGALVVQVMWPEAQPGGQPAPVIVTPPPAGALPGGA